MRWQGPAAPLVQIAICQTHLGPPALHTNATSAIQPVSAAQPLALTVPAPSATTQGDTTSQPPPIPLAFPASQAYKFQWELPQPAPPATATAILARLNLLSALVVQVPSSTTASVFPLVSNTSTEVLPCAFPAILTV